MKGKVSVLIVLIGSLCLPLIAQRRDEAVEVRVESLQQTPVGVSLTLQAFNSPDRLHMMIGLAEARSIYIAMHHAKPERPLGHDLFKTFLDRNGWRVQKVLIRDLQDGTFLADLTLERDRETQVLDARPSDAMAMGLRYGAKIYVNPQVFEEQRKSDGEQEQEKDAKPSEPEQLKL